MKILVTGGAGFIGSHVADAYINFGHQVVIMDNLSTGRLSNVNPAAKFHELDIRDHARVDQVFRQEKFAIVNHHAAQMDVRRSVEDPVYDASVNVLGFLNLLECCVKTGVTRFVFASSGGAIYGEQDCFPADEVHPTRPISPYGVSKLAAEKYLFCYKVVHHLDSVSLRYGNIYGPRQNPEGEAGVVAIFACKMLGGNQPIINGDGRQTRDYVYVGDIASANVLALNHDGSDVFNVGTGVETDVNQLFYLVKDSTNSKCEAQHGPSRKGEQLRSALSHEKITKTLGWKPTVPLREGLTATIEYFKSASAHGS
ncbi:MAG: GDP-mannose 4,6-dehydratase [Ignavibacteria bacterium]|nr:GDP-mannose 4,6-dehydratase [Ignavibacteria bacterium]